MRLQAAHTPQTVPQVPVPTPLAWRADGLKTSTRPILQEVAWLAISWPADTVADVSVICDWWMQDSRALWTPVEPAEMSWVGAMLEQVRVTVMSYTSGPPRPGPSSLISSSPLYEDWRDGGNEVTSPRPAFFVAIIWMDAHP